MTKKHVEPVRDKGWWKCPFCDFKAMNMKTVENHILREHKDVLEAKQKKKDKKKAKSTSERVDYVRELEGKRVRIHLIDGSTMHCVIVRAEDRFNIHVKTDDGRELIIPRGQVFFYEL